MIRGITYLQLRKLESLVGPDKKMRQQIHIVLNKTAGKLKQYMVKQVAGDVAVPQKIIRKTVYIAAKATTGKKGESEVTNAATGIRRSGKIGLKFFKPKQIGTTHKKVSKRLKKKVYKETKRTRVSKKRRGVKTQGGVVYKIDKSGKKGFVASAFQGPTPDRMSIKLNGHAYKRMTKKRLPLAKLHGPSPWGVYTKKKLKRPAQKWVRQQVKKQLKERIRFLTLRAKGKLRGKQPSKDK